MNSETDGAPIRDGLEFQDLGQSLMALGANLTDLGRMSGEREVWDPRRDLAFENLDTVDQIVLMEQAESKKLDTMVQTLNGLRKFRAEYEHLEKVIASYAMHEMSFSQRRTATLLGLGLGTINRLSQSALQEDN